MKRVRDWKKYKKTGAFPRSLNKIKNSLNIVSESRASLNNAPLSISSHSTCGVSRSQKPLLIASDSFDGDDSGLSSVICGVNVSPGLSSANALFDPYPGSTLASTYFVDSSSTSYPHSTDKERHDQESDNDEESHDKDSHAKFFE